MNRIIAISHKRVTVLFLIVNFVMMITLSGCSKTEKVDVSHTQENVSISDSNDTEVFLDSDSSYVEENSEGVTAQVNENETEVTHANSESSDTKAEETPEPSPELTPEPTEAPEPTTEAQEPGRFEVHFLDVGQGDAILVICNDHTMLVDGGKSKESDKIYSFLRNHDIKHLDYIVATHPDADHIGGLAGALNYATVDVALSPVTDNETETFQNFKKYLTKQNIEITVPEAGETFVLGDADVQVIGPKTITNEDNNNSIVLRVIHGNNSFLLTGDAEEEEEQSILRSGVDLKSTVLKVAHHGSAYSTGRQWLNAVSPQIAVISCGSDNEYGHPTEQVLNHLKEMDISVLRTDMHGDIIFQEVEGELRYGVSFDTNEDVYTPGIIPISEEQPEQTSRVSPESDNSESTNEQTYILNTNTKKFHYPDCKSVKQMKDKNKQEYFGTRDNVIAMGYAPCGNCNP